MAIPFRGEFFNLIGNGYSQLDGYGFINAEAAVKAVQKKTALRTLDVDHLSRGPALATVRALSFSRDPWRNSCVTTRMNKALWRVAPLAVLLVSGLLAFTMALAARIRSRVALEAATHRWMTAVNAQDVDDADHDDDRGRRTPRCDAATVTGRDAAIRALREVVTRGRLLATSREITIVNDVAWRVVGFTQTQKNGDVHARGQALEIWKRVNGEWKLHRQMAAGVFTPTDLLTRPSTSEPVLDRPRN